MITSSAQSPQEIAAARKRPVFRDDSSPLSEGVLPAHDLHNHTVASGHADPDATVLNLLSRASSIALAHIGISEHVMRPADLECLTLLERELLSFEMDKGLQPLLGVEMDVDPTDPEGHWVTDDVSCDYIILSAHGFPQFDLRIPISDQLLSQKMQQRRLAERWLSWFGKAVRRGGYDILGHPLRDPMGMGILNLNDRLIFKKAVNSLRPAIEQNAAFELNEAFLSALLPSDQFGAYIALIQELKAAGSKFSRGSDSHGLLKVGACDSIAILVNEAGLAAGDFIDAKQLIGRRR